MRFRDLDPEAIARVTHRGGAHGITHLRSAHGLRSARLLRVQVHGALIASPSRVARRRPGGLFVALVHGGERIHDAADFGGRALRLTSAVKRRGRSATASLLRFG